MELEMQQARTQQQSEEDVLNTPQIRLEPPNFISSPFRSGLSDLEDNTSSIFGGIMDDIEDDQFVKNALMLNGLYPYPADPTDDQSLRTQFPGEPEKFEGEEILNLDVKDDVLLNNDDEHSEQSADFCLPDIAPTNGGQVAASVVVAEQTPLQQSTSYVQQLGFDTIVLSVPSNIFKCLDADQVRQVRHDHTYSRLSRSSEADAEAAVVQPCTNNGEIMDESTFCSFFYECDLGNGANGAFKLESVEDNPPPLQAKDIAYLERRRKNNEASKISRLRRKEKRQANEDLLKQLTEKNKALILEHNNLEMRVKDFKFMLLTKMK